MAQAAEGQNEAAFRWAANNEEDGAGSALKSDERFKEWVKLGA